MRMSGAGRRLAVSVLAWLAITGLATGESAEQTETRLEELRHYLGALHEMRAEFSQEVIGPENEVIERASGSVALSKPGRFRWDYREPYERVIVANGERVWFYEADLDQVTIRRLATGLGDTLAALLTGDSKALDHFELLRSWSADDLQWLQLAPISPEADFSIVDLGFAGGELRQLEFVDRLGQRTRLTLADIDRAPQLTDSDFQFEIPVGVDVIGEDDL